MSKEIKKEFVSRTQLDLLPKRLLMAEETDATRNLNIYIGHLYEKNGFKPMKIMVVGAGGSYSAALFAKYSLCDEMNTPNVEAVTPQTALRILTQFNQVNYGERNPKYDLVIGISYSGKTPDIKRVSELCAEKKFPFILLTGAEKSTLSEIYQESDSMKIISYFNAEDTTGRERGMISMVSTLAPSIIFDDNWTCKMISDYQKDLEKGEKFVSDLNISEIAKLLKQYPVIHVFYEWDTLPTAIDIESKFTESGIANVVLHEKKNFSHGRYTSLCNQKFALVINLTRYYLGISLVKGGDKFYRYKYDESLAKFLTGICKERSAHYIEIGTVAMYPPQWNIEAMSKLPYLITAIGEELNIDISKPLNPFPEEALELYNYEGEF